MSTRKGASSRAQRMQRAQSKRVRQQGKANPKPYTNRRLSDKEIKALAKEGLAAEIRAAIFFANTGTGRGPFRDSGP